jgi:hypothetical protein
MINYRIIKQINILINKKFKKINKKEENTERKIALGLNISKYL